MRWRGVFLSLLSVTTAIGTKISGYWQGELTLVPALSLPTSAVKLEVSQGSWKISSTSSFEKGSYECQTFRLRGYALGYRLALEGKCVLSPQGRTLKHLYRSLGGVLYDQLLWGPTGPHFRYAWLKGEFPTQQGTLSGKAYHSANYPGDITYRYFPQVYAWDAEAGRWRPTGSIWGEVMEAAFIAAKVRLRALVGGVWRSRTEYSLRVTLDPGDRVEPFTLAEAARRYLDAKYPTGWELREPIDLELVKVYLWRRGVSEYSLRFESPSQGQEPEWELEVTFGGRRGLAFEELEFDWEGWHWCGTEGELTISFSQAGFDGFWLELSGFSLFSGITATLELSLATTLQQLSLSPAWRGTSGQTSLYGGVHWHDGTVEGLVVYGLELSHQGGADRKWRALWVVNRPPSPRPSWYTTAGFERLAETGTYEDGLLSLSAWWYGPHGKDQLTLTMYFSSESKTLFGISRVQLTLSFKVTDSLELRVLFQSEDPVTLERDPSLAFTWTLEL